MPFCNASLATWRARRWLSKFFLIGAWRSGDLRNFDDSQQSYKIYQGVSGSINIIYLYIYMYTYKHVFLHKGKENTNSKRPNVFLRGICEKMNQPLQNPTMILLKTSIVGKILPKPNKKMTHLPTIPPWKLAFLTLENWMLGIVAFLLGYPMFQCNLLYLTSTIKVTTPVTHLLSASYRW